MRLRFFHAMLQRTAAAVLLIFTLQRAVFVVSVSVSVSGHSGDTKPLSASSSSTASSSSSSSHDSKKQSYRNGAAKHSSLVSHLPLSYASDFDSYVSYPLDVDPDLDTDLHDVHFDFDTDLDADLDLDDIDLDLDLLKLKYGLYGLNHYSLRNPHFNDYRFRYRYRLRRRPYFRPHHRYFPKYWKHDLDFWGLDNYGLGFSYDKYLYTTSLSYPTSYISVSSF